MVWLTWSGFYAPVFEDIQELCKELFELKCWTNFQWSLFMYSFFHFLNRNIDNRLLYIEYFEFLLRSTLIAGTHTPLEIGAVAYWPALLTPKHPSRIWCIQAISSIKSCLWYWLFLKAGNERKCKKNAFDTF